MSEFENRYSRVFYIHCFFHPGTQFLAQRLHEPLICPNKHFFQRVVNEWNLSSNWEDNKSSMMRVRSRSENFVDREEHQLPKGRTLQLDFLEKFFNSMWQKWSTSSIVLEIFSTWMPVGCSAFMIFIISFFWFLSQMILDFFVKIQKGFRKEYIGRNDVKFPRLFWEEAELFEN